MGCALGVTKSGVKELDAKAQASGGPSFAEGLAGDKISDAWQVSSSVPEEQAVEQVSMSAPSSRSPSVRSLQSTLTSLHSRPFMSSKSSAGLAREDFKPLDLQSDVPTISESIADMQDFWGIDEPFKVPAFLHDHLGNGTSGHSVLPVIVDMRQHPLAPISSVPPKSASSTCMADTVSLDLGRLSEVPSPCEDYSESCCSLGPAGKAESHSGSDGDHNHTTPCRRKSGRKHSFPRAVAPPPCASLSVSQALRPRNSLGAAAPAPCAGSTR